MGECVNQVTAGKGEEQRHPPQYLIILIRITELTNGKLEDEDKPDVLVDGIVLCSELGQTELMWTEQQMTWAQGTTSINQQSRTRPDTTKVARGGVRAILSYVTSITETMLLTGTRHIHLSLISDVALEVSSLALYSHVFIYNMVFCIVDRGREEQE